MTSDAVSLIPRTRTIGSSMHNQQPETTDSSGLRRFACSPAGVVVFIIDDRERILLLSHPNRTGWEAVNGALEANETVLQASLRETQEEVGADLRVRPLGTVHAYTFRYDSKVQHMISLCYLVAFEGGQICPGDDMEGSDFRWWRLEDLEKENVALLVPRDQKWIARRAVELYRLWNNQTVNLQPEHGGKYSS